MRNKILTLINMIIITMTFFTQQICPEEQPVEKIDKKKVDFAIEKVYSERCACELQGIDAMYVNKIIFKISNKSGAAEDVEVILSYYDFFNNRNRTIVKKEKALRKGETRTITMMARPGLMLKSIGITGIVAPRYKNFVEDINETNNTIIIHECMKK
jgi:hypothetical protein